MKYQRRCYANNIVAFLSEKKGEWINQMKDSFKEIFEMPLGESQIRAWNYRKDILRLCNVKYAPFDKDGNGNMDYSFDLDRELAQIFMGAIVKANKDLADVDYVTELLREI